MHISKILLIENLERGGGLISNMKAITDLEGEIQRLCHLKEEYQDRAKKEVLRDGTDYSI